MVFSEATIREPPCTVAITVPRTCVPMPPVESGKGTTAGSFLPSSPLCSRRAPQARNSDRTVYRTVGGAPARQHPARRPAELHLVEVTTAATLADFGQTTIDRVYAREGEEGGVTTNATTGE